MTAVLEREKIVQLLRQWGSSADDALLDPQTKIFTLPDIDGFIGYRIRYGCAVVFGDPVANPKDKETLAIAFKNYCDEKKLKVIYLIASDSFSQWALKNVTPALISFGEEMIVDPKQDPREKEGQNGRLVRRKTRHAQSHGTTVLEYLGNDPAIEKSIEQVAESWLKDRKGPQIYISGVRLFADKEGKRWFYALRDDKVVGVLLMSRLSARKGWALNQFMITPEAANGTPELMIVTALEQLAKEDCNYVTFGAVPANDITRMEGLGKFSQAMTRFSYRIANMIFHLDGKRVFWDKFNPSSEPSYILLGDSSIGIKDMLALMKAMNASLTN